MSVTTLFPTLAGKTFARVNIDRESDAWIKDYEKKHGESPRSPLLDPMLCQQFLEEVHRKRGVYWSYGGYLEDRSCIWRGSYLQKSGGFIHLGVDFNVPQGTPVYTQYDASVMVVDNDGDLDGGWGHRIFLRPNLPMDESQFPASVFIYAHLQNVVVEPGSRIKAGTVLAEVGGPPHNGNWAPHLHVQALRYDNFARILTEEFEDLDGYGHSDHLAELAHVFPNPLPAMGISD